jgi:hypothetical protein
MKTIIDSNLVSNFPEVDQSKYDDYITIIPEGVEPIQFIEDNLNSKPNDVEDKYIESIPEMVANVKTIPSFPSFKNFYDLYIDELELSYSTYLFGLIKRPKLKCVICLVVKKDYILDGIINKKYTANNCIILDYVENILNWSAKKFKKWNDNMNKQALTYYNKSKNFYYNNIYNEIK